MKSGSLLGPWIRRFLLEYMVAERNLSRNTQRSYRGHAPAPSAPAGGKIQTPVDALEIEDLSTDAVRAFLAAIEQENGCTVTTRNQRLSAIHALARFIGERSPEHLAWCGEVRNVPFKRTGKNPLTYLEKAEIEAYWQRPISKVNRAQGSRILLFLYNSGARASEAAAVKITDLDGDARLGGVVKLYGKGGKTRLCPLWPRTMATLLP